MQGQHSAEREAGEAYSSTSPDSPLPRGTVSHHPRAAHHQEGLAQAAARNLQPHVGKSMGCVFFSHRGGSGTAFSFLEPEKWGFFVYSPKGWRVQLLFPIFGGTPLASLPCASTGTSVFTHDRLPLYTL